MEVRVIIISGRAGSGKTSTANEMSEQLKRLQIRHAHIDGDNLDAMYPDEPAADMYLANLAAMWSNYYHLRGVCYVILSGTAAVLETDRITRTMRRVTASIPSLQFHPPPPPSPPSQSQSPTAGGQPTNAAPSPPRLGGKDGRMMPPASISARAFILQVPDALAEKRLSKREVGSELPQLLASSRRMAGVLESQVGGWARRVPTDQREVKEIALDILRTAGWI